jgi:hypothetical protein
MGEPFTNCVKLHFISKDHKLRKNLSLVDKHTLLTGMALMNRKQFAKGLHG